MSDTIRSFETFSSFKAFQFFMMATVSDLDSVGYTSMDQEDQWLVSHAALTAAL